MLHLVFAYGLGLIFSLFNTFRKLTTLSPVPRLYLAIVLVIAACELAMLVKIAAGLHAHSMERTCVEAVFMLIGFVVLYHAARTDK